MKRKYWETYRMEVNVSTQTCEVVSSCLYTVLMMVASTKLLMFYRI